MTDREIVLNEGAEEILRGIAMSLLHRPEDWITTYRRGKSVYDMQLVDLNHKKIPIRIYQKMIRDEYYDTSVICDLLNLRIPDDGRHPAVDLLKDGIKLVRAPEEQRFKEEENKKKEQERLEKEEQRRKFFEALGVV